MAPVEDSICEATWGKQPDPSLVLSKPLYTNNLGWVVLWVVL